MTIHDPSTPDPDVADPDGPDPDDSATFADVPASGAGDDVDRSTFADAGIVDDAVLEEITAAEAAAQRSVVRIPDGGRPEALQHALELRIEANLAQHIPGKPVTRVGSSDPDVRALEAPYSRRRAPEHAQDPNTHTEGADT